MGRMREGVFLWQLALPTVETHGRKVTRVNMLNTAHVGSVLMHQVYLPLDRTTWFIGVIFSSRHSVCASALPPRPIARLALLRWGTVLGSSPGSDIFWLCFNSRHLKGKSACA